MGITDDLKLRHGMPALEALPVDLVVTADLNLHPLAQRIDAGDADAVQTAGHFVVRTVKLAAGVQRRHHHLQCGASLRGMHIDRNTAAIV